MYDGLEIEADIELAGFYALTSPAGVFHNSAILYFYALPPDDETVEIVTGLAIDFEGRPRQGREPLKVNFTNYSAPIFDSWQWQFGDGKISTEMHPQHTYKKAGTYNVKITARIDGNSFSLTKRD